MPGLTEILGKIAASWQKDQETLREAGRQLAALLKEEGPGTVDSGKTKIYGLRLSAMALDGLNRGDFTVEFKIF